MFKIQLDGLLIKNYSDFIKEIQRKMYFPRDCEGSIDRYLDWMRDLSWIQSDTICIQILNSKYFMEENPVDRKNVLEDFHDTIIPFWKYEAEIVIVGGKKRNIILELK